jgi:hypothetical protein
MMIFAFFFTVCSLLALSGNKKNDCEKEGSDEVLFISNEFFVIFFPIEKASSTTAASHGEEIFSLSPHHLTPFVIHIGK